VQRGLDGVRGIAVVPVVMFHLLYLELVPGAELVMSLFFTQSGFLIALLILHERERTGAFALGPFWATRARRILPPAWLTLAGIGLVRVATDELDVPNHMDTVTTLLHVSNWYIYLSNGNAESVFAGRSPALFHTWSLSIEEQFYVAIAVGSLAVLRWAPDPIRTMRAIAVQIALVSFTIPLAFSLGRERVFFGTDTRAGELWVGVALATLLISRDHRSRLLALSRYAWPLTTGALLAAMVIWHRLPPDSDALRRGLLPVGTAIWILVIVGAMLPDGPVAWLTRLWPFRALGRLSYGIYIYHYPIVKIAQAHVDSRTALTLVVVPATLAVAVLSYYAVEMPIRRRHVSRRLLGAGGAAVLGIIVATTVAT
jgi:peptidoglycan/LPS O-acetylase OafA/YrhL